MNLATTSKKEGVVSKPEACQAPLRRGIMVVNGKLKPFSSETTESTASREQSVSLLLGRWTGHGHILLHCAGRNRCGDRSLPMFRFKFPVL